MEKVLKNYGNREINEGDLVRVFGEMWTVCVNGKLRNENKTYINPNRRAHSQIYVVPKCVYENPENEEHHIRNEILIRNTQDENYELKHVKNLRGNLVNREVHDGDLVLVFGEIWTVSYKGKLYDENKTYIDPGRNSNGTYYVVHESVFNNPANEEYEIRNKLIPLSKLAYDEHKFVYGKKRGELYVDKENNVFICLGTMKTINTTTFDTKKENIYVKITSNGFQRFNYTHPFYVNIDDYRKELDNEKIDVSKPELNYFRVYTSKNAKGFKRILGMYDEFNVNFDPNITEYVYTIPSRESEDLIKCYLI